MLIYRIDRQKRIHEILSGKGAELYGGRWNYPGIPAVYCSQARSLAVLEMLVHMDKRHWPEDRIMASIKLPSDIAVQTIKVEDLNSDWNAHPYSSVSQGLFGTYIKHHDVAVLAVPSAVIHEEYNYIINPTHPDADKIEVVATRHIGLDRRLT